MLFAVASGLGASAAQALEHPAQATVERTVGEALDVLRTKKDELVADPALLRSEIDRIVVPHVDFETTTKLAVGRAWRTADAAQRRELVEQFEQLLLRTYAGALDRYSGQKIEFEPFRPENRDDRAVVRSRFEPGAGAPALSVIYKLRAKDGDWKIYDVEVDGLSLVTNYRNAFAAEVGRNGVDGLIAALKSKTAATEG